MSYQDLLKKLYDNHFYPNLKIKIKKDEEVIEGLEIPTSPLLQDRKVERVREIIGESFKADYIPNIEVIIIKKK